MIICPLSNDECNKKITSREKSVFIISRSIKDSDKDLVTVMKNVFGILKKHKFRYVVGAELRSVGDYFCSICSHILGFSFGIAFFSIKFPVPSLCNIFMEKGLMNGFGRPVILFIDELSNLPSDFKREYVIAYNEKNYLKNFEKLIVKLKNIYVYYRDLGDIAFSAGDFEKAARYYKEAWLIGGKGVVCKKVKDLIKKLKNGNINIDMIKKRTLDDLIAFKKLVK